MHSNEPPHLCNFCPFPCNFRILAVITRVCKPSIDEYQHTVTHSNTRIKSIQIFPPISRQKNHSRNLAKPTGNKPGIKYLSRLAHTHGDRLNSHRQIHKKEYTSEWPSTFHKQFEVARIVRKQHPQRAHIAIHHCRQYKQKRYGKTNAHGRRASRTIGIAPAQTHSDLNPRRSGQRTDEDDRDPHDSIRGIEHPHLSFAYRGGNLTDDSHAPKIGGGCERRWIVERGEGAYSFEGDASCPCGQYFRWICCGLLLFLVGKSMVMLL
mmetsp:Transcript_10807/g.23169  ORF Transcript_10807/g.23169 Transcript_10807/m.23169 type:complete len:265 (-) Transcript_10807:93-887(-)